MDLKPKFALRLFLVVMIMLYGSFPLWAGEPTEAIRAAINQGIEILKGVKLDNEKKRAEVVNRLREIVYPLFDFREMAMRSLGSHWRRVNVQQQKEFVSAFTELLEKSYADQIDLYDGQKVVYMGENLDKNYAQVDTKVIAKNNQSFSVSYRLLRVDGKWKIYDVVAENISVVNNYRSQFNRVLSRSSFEELVKTMKEKAN